MSHLETAHGTSTVCVRQVGDESKPANFIVFYPCDELDAKHRFRFAEYGEVSSAMWDVGYC